MSNGMMTHFYNLHQLLAQEEPPSTIFWWALAVIGVVIMVLMGWIYAFAFRHSKGRGKRFPKDPD